MRDLSPYCHGSLDPQAIGSEWFEPLGFIVDLPANHPGPGGESAWDNSAA